MVEQSGKIRVDWSIKNLDTGFILLPQFPLEEVGVSVGGEYTDQKRFGFQNPLTHWTSGRARTVTFDTMLYARHEEEGDTVQTLLLNFVALAEKDDALGRPPICLFVYGETLSETVVVESADYRIVTVLQNGSPRQIDLTLTLRRYVAFSQKQLDPNKPPKKSLYLVASAAEASYEAIALRHYGDPLLGDRLRKLHPQYPMDPPIGAKISVPARSVILREIVDPEFYALSLDDDKAVAAYERILDARNARTARIVV